uniref:Uncharacterized protein n=1 Tax=Arundo donax TaxID=35708 RepID=A0A0A8Y3U3_ARUDO
MAKTTMPDFRRHHRRHEGGNWRWCSSDGEGVEIPPPTIAARNDSLRL